MALKPWPHMEKHRQNYSISLADGLTPSTVPVSRLTLTLLRMWCVFCSCLQIARSTCFFLWFAAVSWAKVSSRAWCVLAKRRFRIVFSCSRSLYVLTAVSQPVTLPDMRKHLCKTDSWQQFHFVMEVRTSQFENNGLLIPISIHSTRQT